MGIYAPDEIQNIMFMPLDEKSFHWEHFSWCIIDIFIPFPRAIIPWTPFLRSFYRLWLPLPLNKFNSSGLLYIYFPAPKEAWLQLSSTGYNNIFYPPINYMSFKRGKNLLLSGESGPDEYISKQNCQ